MAQPVPVQPISGSVSIAPSGEAINIAVQVIETKPAAVAAGSNGLTPYHVVAAATTNDAVLSDAPGRLSFLHAINVAATMEYLKLYDKAEAPVVGTDIPALTLGIPAGGALTLDFDALGVSFAAGLGIGITGAAADSDTTAVAAGDVILNLMYTGTPYVEPAEPEE